MGYGQARLQKKTMKTKHHGVLHLEEYLIEQRNLKEIRSLLDSIKLVIL